MAGMRFNIRCLLTALWLCFTCVAAEPKSDSTVTVWAWPMSSAKPQELAQISYNPFTLTSSVLKYTPPTFKDQKEEDFVRVGLYDPKTSNWRGAMTSAASFEERNKQQVTLHVDQSGSPYHVGITAFLKDSPDALRKAAKEKARESRKASRSGTKTNRSPRPTTAARQEEDSASPLMVEIVKPAIGPSTHLNKPVVLSAEGKMPEQEQEKTFLQKYWWVIAAFFVLQLFMASPQEKESK